MIRAWRNAFGSYAVAAVVLCLVAPGPVGTGELARASDTGGGAGNAVAARRARGFARQMLRLQNTERRRHGLRRLAVSRSLNRTARRHARDMVRRHYFGHVSLGGRDVVDRVASTGYGRRRGFAVQENLYWWSPQRSARTVVRAWMSSAVHRANLLNGRWRQFGVGVMMRSPNGRRGVTVVGVYGTKR